MSWERECLQLAVHLSTRRLDSMGWRGDAIAMQALFSKGVRAQAFAHHLGQRNGVAEAGILARFRSEVNHDRCPSEVGEALRHCEKQFQQWNVERAELDTEFQLTPFEQFTVGAAGRVPEDLRVPRWQAHASLELARWVAEQEMAKLMDARHRVAIRQLLTQPLPYGRPDDEPMFPKDDERGGDL